jgi:hypothetical protein
MEEKELYSCKYAGGLTGISDNKLKILRAINLI